MPAKPHDHRLRAQLISIAAALALSGCGGGGGDEVVSPGSSPVATAIVEQPASAALSDATSEAEQMAAAMSASRANDMAALLPTTPGPGSDALALAISVEADLPALSVAAGAAAAATRTYYVDSRAGSDANNGLAASVASGGLGPWRSLARLATAALQPGDTVRLVCGSTWNETLQVANSGTSASPITVAAYPSGCANPPAVDGATALVAASWTSYKGNIYKATLAASPLQLDVGSGAMTRAHHPNRGYDATQPASLYLKVAADADRVTINGRTGSTTLTTGSDLVLPSGASLQAGLTVRVRDAAWNIDESRIGAVSAKKLTLTTPTAYPLTAGWGYYLLGALWMLDSAGEWHHDAATKTLYAWMPDSRPPTATVQATTLATGIDLSSRQYITIDGLAVRHAGVGVYARGSKGVTLRNSRIEDTAGIGLDAAASAGFIAASNTISRTGGDAIHGVDYGAGTATDMQVVGNAITDSAVLTSGDTVLSLPVRSYAAIRGGTRAVISGNTITNANYIGIWAWPSNAISDNVISGACTLLDDCGGIYAAGAANGSTIRGNLVLNARGAMPGKGPGITITQAQGIFMDESASGILVQGNTAAGNDFGIHMHVAARNTLSGNKLYGNRTGQLRLQETRNTDNAAGDVFGNVITGNQIAADAVSAKAVSLETGYAGTAHFGTFDGNRFLDRVYAMVVDESTATTRTRYGFGQWQAAAMASGATRGNEPHGWAASSVRYATSLVNGSNLIQNGNFANGTAGWTTWNQTAPYGTLVREACVPGWCARFTAGASESLVSSPTFSIVGGTWYRLSVDIAADSPGQTVDMVVRRSGGGSNGYESLSDRSLKFSAGGAWQRYTFTFQAAKTIKANDPVTGDKGARVDFQTILPGRTLSLSNLELVPVTPPDAMNRSDLLLNTSSAPMSVACPAASTRPGLCAYYFRLSDGLAVTWPYTVPARSSDIVFAVDSSVTDSDADGVADSQDRCPATPAGFAANSKGCALGQ